MRLGLGLARRDLAFTLAILALAGALIYVLATRPELKPVELSFSLEPGKAVSGTQIRFSGILASRGRGLEGLPIFIQAKEEGGWRTLDVILTGPHGRFAGQIQAPHGLGKHVLRAYFPGADGLRSASSREAEVEVIMDILAMSIVDRMGYPSLELEVLSTLDAEAMLTLGERVLDRAALREGENTIYLKMADAHVTPEPGCYVLLIWSRPRTYGEEPELLYRRELVFEGARLIIEDVDKMIVAADRVSLRFIMRNEGDLPAYPYQATLVVSDRAMYCTSTILPSQVIMPGSSSSGSVVFALELEGPVRALLTIWDVRWHPLATISLVLEGG